MRKSLTILARSGLNPISKKILTRSIVTIEEAKQMTKRYNEMPNEVLLSMAIMGDQEAREERLIREIMAVDNLSW